MAKKTKSHGGSCTVKRISFKTKRGKVISFMGRPGGMKSAGGVCADKKRSTKHLAPFKKEFKGAVRACLDKSHKRHGKHGVSPFNKCIASEL